VCGAIHKNALRHLKIDSRVEQIRQSMISSHHILNIDLCKTNAGAESPSQEVPSEVKRCTRGAGLYHHRRVNPVGSQRLRIVDADSKGISPGFHRDQRSQRRGVTKGCARHHQRRQSDGHNPCQFAAVGGVFWGWTSDYRAREFGEGLFLVRSLRKNLAAKIGRPSLHL